MKELKIKSLPARIRKVKELIQSAGNKLFAVTFIKRSDGSKRRMVARRHVVKTQYAKSPMSRGKLSCRRKQQDDENKLVTVFDCNCLKYNKHDKLSGRGAFKSIPLDGIIRIKVNGEIYQIK